MIFEVIVDISNSQVDKVFDYKGEDFFQIGQRVLVPFGNKEIEGFIVNVKESSTLPDEKLKNILMPLDSFVAISKEMLDLAHFMQSKYNLRLVDVLRLAIPSQMRGGKVKDIFVRVCSNRVDLSIEEILDIVGTRATKQRELVLYLEANPNSFCEEINKKFGTALNSLISKNLVDITLVPKIRTPYKDLEHKGIEHNLTVDQTKVVDEILSNMQKSYLLFGVTGSGKTEVYMNVISQVVSQNKTAIMLVPEISLTPNMLRLFRTRYGSTVAILHSGLSVGERYDEWKRLKNGEATIAIGARSAIFAPLKNVGVIIIDEEHDSSYQSETNPRYDTIEVAKFRREYNNCALILGSATPSLSSYYDALNGKLTLLELKNRINNKSLPEVEIVDMTHEIRSGNNQMFSNSLLSELKKVIESGNQAMIFINRRGYSSYVMCTKCGYVAKCSDCDVSLTYHKEENELHCHYCGKRYKMFDNCPQCKSPYIRQGKIGTQQVVAYLNKLFPSVKVLRMDFDTTQTKEAHSQILDAFSNREAQILVGTQMIAKGHDFPFVTLVGILDGDQSLYYSDYMATERTFQLITQVAGRSGRDTLPGKVILQTFSPKHYCLVLSARQDYLSFYKKEINLRQVTKFPPFAVVVRILYSGLNAEDCISVLNAQYEKIQKIKEKYGDDFIFLQRMRCAVKYVEKKHRYQTLMRLSNEKSDEILQEIFTIANEKDKNVSVFVEINPQNMN